MTREEAKKEIEKVFVPEYANYIITALTEGATVSDKAPEQESCKDCISREATIDGINRYFHDEYYQRTSIQDCMGCLIEDVIRSLPPVHPKPKTGHWIERPNCYECSECGIIRAKETSGKYNYCPNCGADMTEVTE